jgi:hypothetical protein
MAAVMRLVFSACCGQGGREQLSILDVSVAQNTFDLSELVVY